MMSVDSKSWIMLKGDNEENHLRLHSRYSPLGFEGDEMVSVLVVSQGMLALMKAEIGS